MKALKQVLKDRTIRTRILTTFLILFIFQLGTLIPLPGVRAKDTLQTTSDQGIALLNLTTGGALNRFGLLALGVSPYITASILVQLLGMDLSKTVTRWRKMGPAGSQKLTALTRVLTFVIGWFNGYALLESFSSKDYIEFVQGFSRVQLILAATVLATGAVFVAWLGDRIHIKGIGNGPSLLISSGIVVQIPGILKSLLPNSITPREVTQSVGWYLLLLAFIGLIIYINNIECRLPLQSLQSEKKTAGHYLPIRLLAGNVMPVIFAGAVLSILAFLTRWWPQLQPWTTYTEKEGLVLYAVLIFVFTYASNITTIDPETLADNLKQSAMHIQNVPYSETESVIFRTVVKLSHAGAPALVIIAVLPILASKVVPGFAAVSGTSLIIITSVCESLKDQIVGLTIRESYPPLIERKDAK